MSPAGKWCDSCTGPHGHIKELRFVSEAPMGPLFTSDHTDHRQRQPCVRAQ